MAKKINMKYSVASWFEKVYRDGLDGDTYNQLWKLKFDYGDVVNEMVELINQIELSPKEKNKLNRTPEFLLDYYIVKEKGALNSKQKERLRKDIQSVLLKDKALHRFYDSYEEFTLVIENSLINHENGDEYKLVKKSNTRLFSSKFWRFISAVVIIVILPGTILQLMKLIYLIQSSNEDYLLGVTTGSLTVNVVVIGLAIWFFVKLKKKS